MTPARLAAPLLLLAASACAERPVRPVERSEQKEPAQAAAAKVEETAPSPAPSTSPSSSASAVAAAAPAPSAREPVAAIEVTTTRFSSTIYDKPRTDSFIVGTFHAGAHVRARDEAVEAGPGVGTCPERWVHVEPVGYVCEGREGVTTDFTHPNVVAMAEHQTRRDEPLPYGYGMSNGTALYARVPTPSEQKVVETDLEAHLKQFAEQRKKGPPEKLPPLSALPIEPIPPFLDGHAQAPLLLPWAPKGRVLKGSYAIYLTRLAFLSAFESDGREFYLTTEGFIAPANRIKAYRLSDFHGVELAPPGEEGAHLPVVWSRHGNPIALFRADGDKPVQLTEKLALQHYAEVAEKPVVLRGMSFYGILHPEVVLGSDAKAGERYLLRTVDGTRVDPVAAKDKPERVGESEVWIDVHIGTQTLTLYEGLVPRYTTLVSTGAGKNHETPLGHFRVYSKQVTARMSADEQPAEEEGGEPEKAYRYDDVPFVQYLFEGIALHAAFWHEGFGLPRSHGCINLAPRDALWLFQHTLPEVPQGWHVMNAGRGGIPYGTLVAIRY